METIEETKETHAVNEIELLKRKIKMCDKISITAVILIAVCMIASFLISKLMKDRQLALALVRGITGFLMILPIAAMAPLFFRTNLKNKLTLQLREKQ